MSHQCEVNAETGWCRHERPESELAKVVNDALAPLFAGFEKLARAFGRDMTDPTGWREGA